MIAGMNCGPESRVVSMKRWLHANGNRFKPPICNWMLHDQQLKVFLVGGPNARLDYHLNQGEEFFYMIKGDMCLKVIEGGKHKDVIIREGQAFLLPGRVPHSPQRTANTIGLVIERQRLPNELDGLRFYVTDSSTEILYERWFHCYDLATQLQPIIKQFLCSKQFRTGKPDSDSLVRKAPFDDDSEVRLKPPVDVEKWLQNVAKGQSMDGNVFSPFGKEFNSWIRFYGSGRHEIINRDFETMLWLMPSRENRVIYPEDRDSACLQYLTPDPAQEETVILKSDDCVLLPPNSRWKLDNDLKSGTVFAATMMPSHVHSSNSVN